jgi:hypothetical protein
MLTFEPSLLHDSAPRYFAFLATCPQERALLVGKLEAARQVPAVEEGMKRDLRVKLDTVKRELQKLQV